MTIAEFWNAQRFHYLTTYSFNRGPILSALRDAIAKDIEELRQSVSPSRFIQQLKLKRQLTEIENQLSMGVYRKRLTTGQLIIDSTADRIALIKPDSIEGKQLDAVFRAPPREVVYAACPPTYRDALAFYDEQGNLLRVLNICFGCLYMEADNGLAVEADIHTYEALRNLLITLGHPIEDEWS